jgi:hypothetical protein
MKVMCIKDGSEYATFNNGERFRLNENERVYCGEIYTVILFSKGLHGVRCYKLAERPYNGNYRIEYFSPISEIDETEMIRESYSALYYL